MNRPTILVIDDKENMLKLFKRVLGGAYDLATASDGGQALAILETRSFDLVITDIRMPGADGFEVLKAVKQRSPDTEVVLMTAYASVQKAVEAIKDGAYDYIQKPFDPDDVALVVSRAIERKRLRALTHRAELRPAREFDAAIDPRAGLSHEKDVTVEALSEESRSNESGHLGTDSLVKLPYREAVDLNRDRISRDYLTLLLREFSGNVTRAAERAGMERESLHRLLKRYGVRSEDFKRDISK